MKCERIFSCSLRWHHDETDGVSYHQPHHCLLNRLFGRRSKKTPKLRVTGLGAGNSPGTGEFPAQMASNAENVSIWWRHHVVLKYSERHGLNHFTYIGSDLWLAPQSAPVALLVRQFNRGTRNRSATRSGEFYQPTRNIIIYVTTALVARKLPFHEVNETQSAELHIWIPNYPDLNSETSW